MNSFYELKCIEATCGWYEYYYFYTHLPVHGPELKKPMPDKMRLLIDDRESTPVSIERLNPLQYFWRKHFKRYFNMGYRVNWEKTKL